MSDFFVKEKKMAKEIGLAYWEALVSDHGVDPIVFVYAEAVLSQEHGLCGWRNGEHYTGGWDSGSHYGVSAENVANMWKAAGCRNSEKFRFQVANRLVAKKGDSLAFLRHYQEGLKWLKRWRFGLISIPRKTIAVLGRVSPEARHALVSDIRRDHEAQGIRIRDLNWAKVREVEQLRAEGSERSLLIRAALLPTEPALLLLGYQYRRGSLHPVGRERLREFCPAYPNLQLEIAVRIALGTSPVALSQNLLTRKEAHQWLLAGGPSNLEPDIVRESVIRWLVRDLDLQGFVPRDVEVGRWLLHVHQRGAWSALVKVQRFPDGRRTTYLGILDEVIPEDLDRGISTGVERAFTRSKERLAQVDAKDHRTICLNPFQQLPRWVALLTTPAALAMEGRIQDHCVGGYASQVKKGQCLILSIISTHGRSTVEIRRGDQGWWLAQHYGYRNGPPPPRHKILLRAWLNRENQALLKSMAA